jgi:hypothetical protein
MSCQKIVSTLLLIFTLAGCVTYTKTVNTKQPLNLNSGYIYGRLSVHHERQRSTQIRRDLEIGLVLKDKETSETYTMLFKGAKMISIIAVKPGVYTVDKVSFASKSMPGAPTQIGEQPIVDYRLPKEFTVEAGKGYYIGDFEGSTKSYPELTWRGAVTYEEWHLTPLRDNFDATTSEVKENYPNLSELETTSVIKKN